jgi:ubiquinone biosynthesis protein Coq4
VVTDRLLEAILDANAQVPDVTFLALLGRPTNPITICMCADYLIPLTLYQGEDIPQALDALSRTVTYLLQARQAF